jgi:hypothetical protein
MAADELEGLRRDAELAAERVVRSSIQESMDLPV